MGMTLTHTTRGLANDCEHTAVTCKADMVRVVRTNAFQGNGLAKGYARISSGSHGKRYPNAFSVTPLGPMVYEYGPLASKPQGNMLFEGGEGRQSHPHRDLARSLEKQAPKFRRDVAALPDAWYWPGT